MFGIARQINYLAKPSGANTSTYWWTSYSATGTPTYNGVVEDSLGNVYITGSYGTSAATNTFVAYLLKLDSSGNKVWERTLDVASSEELGNGIGIDSSNNLYITGATGVTGSLTKKMLVAKYASDNTLTWQRTIDVASTNESANCIVADSAGNTYIGGYGLDPSNAASFLKFDTSGTLLWQKYYASNNSAGINEPLNGVALDSTGVPHFVGIRWNTAASNVKFWTLLKVTTAGALTWARTVTGTGTDYFTSAVAIDASGNFYALGYAGVFPTIIKYNSAGTIQWQNRISQVSTTSSQPFGCQVDSAGNVYISGQINGTFNGSFLIKLTSAGAISYQRTITGSWTKSYLKGNNIYLYGPSGVLKLPIDGSKTGTFGSVTIATGSFTIATSTETLATFTPTILSSALTAATSTLTNTLNPATKTLSNLVSIP